MVMPPGKNSTTTATGTYYGNNGDDVVGTPVDVASLGRAPALKSVGVKREGKRTVIKFTVAQRWDVIVRRLMMHNRIMHT